MNGSLHAAAGLMIGVGTGLVLYQEPSLAVSYSAGCVVGSLMPDIDSPKSIISRFCPPISVLIQHYFGHRKLFHAPIVPICMLFIRYLASASMEPIGLILFGGFIAGYTVHLLQDFCTMGGIPLLYPFIKKRYTISGAKSGSLWNYPATVLIIAGWFTILLNGVNTPLVLASYAHKAFTIITK